MARTAGGNLKTENAKDNIALQRSQHYARRRAIACTLGNLQWQTNYFVIAVGHAGQVQAFDDYDPLAKQRQVRR